MSIEQYLTTQSLNLLSQVPQVLEIDSKLKVPEAYGVILKNNLLSAPVYDSQQSKYVGFLDVRELAKYISAYHRKMRPEQQSEAKFITRMALRSLSDNNVVNNSVSYLARLRPFKSTLKPSDSVLTALKALEANSRLPVIDTVTGKVVNIISQSNVINYLNANQAKFGSLMQTKLSDAKLASLPALCVREDSPFIDSVDFLSSKELSGAGIIDAQGRLVGNISASDLKLWLRLHDLGEMEDQEQTRLLLSSKTLGFIQAVHWLAEKQERADVVAVNASDTVGDALQTMANAHVHRVFYHAEDGSLGVVACTDVIRYLLQHLGATLTPGADS